MTGSARRASWSAKDGSPTGRESAADSAAATVRRSWIGASAPDADHGTTYVVAPASEPDTSPTTIAASVPSGSIAATAPIALGPPLVETIVSGCPGARFW